MASAKNPYSGEEHFSASIAENHLLTLISIYQVSTGQLDTFLEAIGFTGTPCSELAVETLAPHFPTRDVTFLSKGKRTISTIGAVLHLNEGEAVFLFQIAKGALGSPVLIDEIARSIQVELIQP